MSRISGLLLDWYDEHGRVLPWRGETDPYRIWLSEIMLQQTRVETVIRYYSRFLEAFPDVASLAEASEDHVLKLWEGLGYYSRARNLHRAARMVHESMSDRFPATVRGLRSLPGVGPYAANAIASIASGECVPALDGNQARVISRLTAWETPLSTPFDLEQTALAFMSCQRPGDHNQALMDLGALICLPKRPHCFDCPLRDLCLGFRSGDPEAFPVRRPPAAKRIEARTVMLIRVPEGIAMRRRPSKGLLGGLYEFPSVEGSPAPEELCARLADEGWEGVVDCGALPSSSHVFTHLVWHMTGRLLKADRFPEGITAVRDLSACAIPSALRVYRRIAEGLLDHDA